MSVLALGTSIESLLVVVALMLISAVSNWLQKRRQEREQHPPSDQDILRPKARPPHAPDSSDPVPKRVRWEEELRRLLEGDSGETAPKPPPKPPVVVARPSQPRPIIPPRLPTKPIESPVFQEGGPNLPTLARMEESREAYERARRTQEIAQEQVARRGALPAATAAYHQGESLQAKVAEHFKATDAQTQRPVIVKLPKQRLTSREAAGALALIKNPQTVRQVFVASLIFGRPKAFDDQAPAV